MSRISQLNISNYHRGDDTSQENMETVHIEELTGHIAEIFLGNTCDGLRWSAMVCDGLRCFWKLKIAGKQPISSQRVAGPYGARGNCPVYHRPLEPSLVHFTLANSFQQHLRSRWLVNLNCHRDVSKVDST